MVFQRLLGGFATFQRQEKKHHAIRHHARQKTKNFR